MIFFENKKLNGYNILSKKTKFIYLQYGPFSNIGSIEKA